MGGYIQIGCAEIGSDKWTELNEYRVQFRAGQNDQNYDSR
jgi:hypothetical protein